MERDLEYALVTSSALPQDVKGSRYYESLEKDQWLDLVEYSSDLVKSNEGQEVLFLIVAKGTDDQITEDEERRAKKNEHYIQACKERDCARQKSEDLKSELLRRTEKYNLLKSEMEAVMGSKHQLSQELQGIREEDREEEEKDKERADAAESRKKTLRKKSVELFNALYSK